MPGLAGIKLLALHAHNTHYSKCHQYTQSLYVRTHTVHPDFCEMTVLGAAIATGTAVRMWEDTSLLPTPAITPFQLKVRIQLLHDHVHMRSYVLPQH